MNTTIGKEPSETNKKGIGTDLLVICLTAAAGSLLAAIPGFPFPGSVAGMILMLLLLLFRLIRLEWVEKAADFFLTFLPLFFIPLVVNILDEQELLSAYGLKIAAVIFLSSIITIITTALTVRFVLFISGRFHGSVS